MRVHLICQMLQRPPTFLKHMYERVFNYLWHAETCRRPGSTLSGAPSATCGHMLVGMCTRVTVTVTELVTVMEACC